MASIDVRFSGSVPANYERYMVPLLFRPYAEIVAGKAAGLASQRILEVAAGTGVVTSALAAKLPGATIVATDLNQAMLDVAAESVDAPNVEFKEADALALPFGDEGFDLVVCQFGSMFYPDRVRGHAEARRVLRTGGSYLLAIWDRLELNVLTDIAQKAMEQCFPDNPPMFMKRGPFSYCDPQSIDHDLRAAGFEDIWIETFQTVSRSPSAEDAARGLCYGSPMSMELEAYGPDALNDVFELIAQAAKKYEGPNGFEAPMSAHIVTATK